MTHEMRDKVLSLLNPDGYEYLFVIMKSMSLPLKESEVDVYVESWANCYATIAASNGMTRKEIDRIRGQIKGEYAIFKIVMKFYYQMQ